MTAYVRAPSRFSSHIHYKNSDLRCHFIICGYGICLYLRHTLSYPRTIYAYDLWISFSFSFVSTVWRHFFPFSFVSKLYPILPPSVSTLYSIIYPPVSILDSIYYWFDPTLTTFTTRSLVYGGPIWRVSMRFHHIIMSQNFANRAPFRDLVKKSASICSVLQYEIDIFLILILSLEKK